MTTREASAIAPTVPAALLALADMEIELNSAATYEALRKVERAAEALKVLFRDVGEVKNRAELVVLGANHRIGQEIKAVPKASGRPLITPPRLSNFERPAEGPARPTRAELGVSWNRSSALQKLASVPKPEIETIAARLQDAGKDATLKAVLRVVHEEELRERRAAYDARAGRGGTVADLRALAESGKRFAVIYADPPWAFRNYNDDFMGTSRQHYSTMPIHEIKAMPVAPLAAKDCVLFLWATMPQLPEALDTIAAWGFEYKTTGFTWIKQKSRAMAPCIVAWDFGRAPTPSFCPLATRGAPARMATDVHQVIMAPRGEHSAKPEEARRRIERLVLGPYLELFARRPVEGWTVWGDEVEAEWEPASRLLASGSSHSEDFSQPAGSRRPKGAGRRAAGR